MSRRLLPVIILLPWVTVNGTQIIAVLQEMSRALSVSETSVKFISTIPNLTMIISSLIGGTIVGRHLSYKAHVLIAAMLMVLSGTGPYFMDDFKLIMVTRGIFGFAMGFMSSVSSSIIFRFIPVDKRARYMGYGTTSMFSGTVIYMLIGGVLGNYGWRYVFLIHLLVLIPMTVVVMRLPKKLHSVAPIEAHTYDRPKTRIGARLPPLCIFFILTSAIYHLFFQPLLVNIPFILSGMGIGSPSTASIVLSLNTIAAALAGGLFGFAAKKLRRYVLPFAYVLCAAGMCIAFFATGLPLLILGSMIAGGGFAMTTMAMLLEVGTFVPKEDIGLFSGINMAANCVGVFCATAYMGLLTRLGLTSPRAPLAVSSVGVSVLMLITLGYIIVNGRRKDRGL